MSDFQTILSVINEAGGDRDAFIAAYQKRLAKGNAQPAPTEPTPERKGDTFTRVLAGIIVEAERAAEYQKCQDADLVRRLAALDRAAAEGKRRTIEEGVLRKKATSHPNSHSHQASLNEPGKLGRGNTELRESVNLGRIVGRRE